MAKSDHDETKQSQKARSRAGRRKRNSALTIASLTRGNTLRDYSIRNGLDESLMRMLVAAARKGDGEAASLVRRHIEFIEEEE